MQIFGLNPLSYFGFDPMKRYERGCLRIHSSSEMEIQAIETASCEELIELTQKAVDDPNTSKEVRHKLLNRAIELRRGFSPDDLRIIIELLKLLATALELLQPLLEKDSSS